MLSMHVDLRASEIAGFTKLPARSQIWLVHGFENDDLVVKYEQVITRDIVKPTSQVLKAIDPLARMKMLRPSEVIELRKALVFAFTLSDVPTSQVHHEQLRVFIDAIDGKNYEFTKMHKQVMMDLDSAVKRAIDGDVKDIKLFTESLKRSGGLEGLGEVVAGDAFIGNEDRFMFGKGSNERTIGGHKYVLQCIYNVGNVMLAQRERGKFKAAMLDYMDPGNLELFKPVNENSWPGRYLLTDQNRTAMATLVVNDLELLLSPVQASAKPKLGRDAAKRVRAGIEEGVRKILRQFLAYEKQKHKLPPGVESRLQLLRTAGIKA